MKRTTTGSRFPSTAQAAAQPHARTVQVRSAWTTSGRIAASSCGSSTNSRFARTTAKIGAGSSNAMICCRVALIIHISGSSAAISSLRVVDVHNAKQGLPQVAGFVRCKPLSRARGCALERQTHRGGDPRPTNVWSAWLRTIRFRACLGSCRSTNASASSGLSSKIHASLPSVWRQSSRDSDSTNPAKVRLGLGASKLHQYGGCRRVARSSGSEGRRATPADHRVPWASLGGVQTGNRPAGGEAGRRPPPAAGGGPSPAPSRREGVNRGSTRPPEMG